MNIKICDICGKDTDSKLDDSVIVDGVRTRAVKDGAVVEGSEEFALRLNIRATSLGGGPKDICEECRHRLLRMAVEQMPEDMCSSCASSELECKQYGLKHCAAWKAKRPKEE